nr:MAG TPA: hypothetical protein [Caudoviricetes sp.]
MQQAARASLHPGSNNPLNIIYRKNFVEITGFFLCIFPVWT